MFDEILRAGTFAGDYRVLRPIGKGGMGTVYAAKHPELGAEVAVKVLNSAQVTDPNGVARFAQEAKVLAQLQHPSTVTPFNIGQLPDGRHFYVMELLRGQTLAALLAERERLEPARVITILEAVASALDAAHERGIIHRDVKPSNIYLLSGAESQRSEVRLLDFGLAKLLSEPDAIDTVSGQVAGSPQYMSPEQCRGRSLDARADVYSLGVVAYKMLSGAAPFAGKTFGEIVALQQTQDVPPLGSIAPWVTTDVARAIEPALHKDPARRPASAGALVARLRRAVAAVDVAAVDDGAQATRSNKRWIVGLALLLLALSGVLVASSLRLGPGPPLAKSRAQKSSSDADRGQASVDGGQASPAGARANAAGARASDAGARASAAGGEANDSGVRADVAPAHARTKRRPARRARKRRRRRPPRSTGPLIRF